MDFFMARRTLVELLLTERCFGSRRTELPMGFSASLAPALMTRAILGVSSQLRTAYCTAPPSMVEARTLMALFSRLRLMVLIIVFSTPLAFQRAMAAALALA